MTDAIEWMAERYVRLTLAPDTRARIYTTLAMLLENKVQLISALDKLYDVFTDGGTSKKSAAAIFLAEARARIRDGQPISAAFARYISQDEASIIQAGERSGRLREAFRDAIDLIKRKSAVKKAIVAGAAYPAVLCILLVVMFYIIATRLMPALAKAIDLDSLGGTAYMLHIASSALMSYGVHAAIAAAVLTAWIAWSMPRLTGKWRVRLDRLPPWSIYRANNGSAFLLNVSVMVQSGIKLLDALQQLYEPSNAYMRERIGATIQGIQRGRNLGEALHDAELEFPDKEAVKLVLLLAGNSGFEQSLYNFAIEWSDQTVARVQAIMRMFFIAALMAVGGTAVMIVSSTAEIQNAIEQANQR